MSTAPWQHGLDEAANALPDHVFGNVDDCIRCIYCEALASKPGPCRGQMTVIYEPCPTCVDGKRDGCDCIDQTIPKWVPRG